MVKTFFDPSQKRFTPWSGTGRLPKITKRHLEHSAASYRSDGKDEDDEDEDPLGNDVTALMLRKIDKKIKKATAGMNPEDMLSIRTMFAEVIGKKNKDGEYEEGILNLTALRALTDDKSGAMSLLLAQGTKITQLENQIKQGGEDMSIRGQVTRWMKTNEAAIKARKEGTSQVMPELTLDLRFAGDILQTRDANSPMTPANTMPGGTTYITRFEVDPTVNQPLRPQPTLWEVLRKGRTNSETYAWVNKKPTTGDAGFIAPGVYKPAISFTLESETSKAKKIAANEKMAIELLDDIDGFVTWVETELRYALDIKLNAAVSTGVSSNTDINGIVTLSNPFPALSGCEAQKANIWDAISACTDVLRARFLTGPIICRIHPIDLGNAKRTKADNQGQIFIPPVTGAYIVEDYTQTKGTISVFASDYYKLLIYKAFFMRWGWENDDFTKNLVTVIGELRLHQYVSDNYIEDFAITDTLANIIAAIDVAPMP